VLIFVLESTVSAAFRSWVAGLGTAEISAQTESALLNKRALFDIAADRIPGAVQLRQTPA
jgi:hypothetical protein